jgi:hypothetical protein
MLISEQNDEECDATGDDSSNHAGSKITLTNILHLVAISSRSNRLIEQQKY